jgi:hypothetical protein
MYVCYIVARSRDNCCHGNAKIRYVFIFVGIDVAVNNIKVFSVSMEIQQLVPFAPFSSSRIFRTAVNNSYEVLNIMMACLYFCLSYPT